MFVIKKITLDKKYLTIALYTLFVICCSIGFEKILGNISGIGTNIRNVLTVARNILSPFITGLFVAYILNSGVRAMENQVLNLLPFFRTHQKQRRLVAAIATYILLIGAILWIIAYLIPEVRQSFETLMSSLSNAQNSLSFYAYNSDSFIALINGINEAFGTNYTYRDFIGMIFEPLVQSAAMLPSLLNKVLLGTVNAAYVVLNFIVGLVISFYMLCDKENFAALITKILMTVFKKSRAEKIIHIAKTSNAMFERFFIGKVLDSVIVGLIFFVICLFAKPPYMVLLCLIIGVTNMIPYFGPFIGAVPVVLIVFINNPMAPSNALWMIAIIFVLQQFDGIVLGPKILGDSTGLKPLGVIFAILVGGALFDVLGMFLGVPVFAVLRNMLLSIMDKEYDKKYVTVPDKGLNAESEQS